MRTRRSDSPSGGAGNLLAAALLCTGLVAAPLGAAANGSSGQVRKPSDLQLARLQQYEEYIAYFTSLGYGPSQSRVSPEYIRALVLTESAGEKFAVSHKGARGLTQVMPDTGRMAAGEIVSSGVDYRFIEEERLARYNPDLLYDPAINLLIACYLSSIYHTDYRGSAELVASAWNAGPAAVAKYGNRTPPYSETRGMVARLVGYLNYFAVDGPYTYAARGPRWADMSHERWKTSGWNEPGWDGKKIDWNKF